MAKKSKKKFSILKLISIILGSIVLIFCLLIGGIASYDAIAFSSFYKEARKEFRIPGLGTGFTPQGLAYSKEEKVFIGSGYDKSNNETILYVINDKDNTSKEVRLTYNNKNYKGHAGGIAIHNDDVFISNGGYVYILSLSDVLKSSATERAVVKNRFKVFVNASFCFAGDDALYVGEFYDAKNGYNTHYSHHVEGKDYDNHALIMKYPYEFVSLGTLTSVQPIPTCAYSVCDRVQGVAISPSGKMALSTSWGLNNSHIYIHNIKDLSGEIKNYKYDKDDKEESLPLYTYILNSSTLEKDVVAPPMAEELEYIDGRIYIFNESACNKYIFGKFTRAKNVYSYPMA